MTAEGIIGAVSAGQRVMWMLDRYRKGSGVMSVPVLLHLTGQVDRRALEETVAGLLRRHEALRTHVVRRDHRLLRIVEPDPQLSIETYVADSRAAAEARAVDWLRTPVELDNALPLSVALVTTGEQESVLVLNVHHLVTDAWSNAVICRDLAELYNAAVEGRPPELPPIAWQYGDWVAWQRSRTQPTAETSTVAADGPYRTPALRPRPSHRARESPPAGQLWLELGQDDFGAIRELARQTRTGSFAILVATLLMVLARHTGQRDLAIGSIYANRQRREISQTVGYFANLAVIRARIEPEFSFGDAVSETRRAALTALADQGTPYVPRPGSPSEPESVVFHQLATPPGVPPVDKLRFAGLQVEQLRLPAGTGSRFDFELLGMSVAGGLDLVFRYAADQYDQAFIETLSTEYLDLLRAGSADPAYRL